LHLKTSQQPPEESPKVIEDLSLCLCTCKKNFGIKRVRESDEMTSEELPDRMIEKFRLFFSARRKVNAKKEKQNRTKENKTEK
jgi:hypothetical protein